MMEGEVMTRRVSAPAISPLTTKRINRAAITAPERGRRTDISPLICKDFSSGKQVLAPHLRDAYRRPRHARPLIRGYIRPGALSRSASGVTSIVKRNERKRHGGSPSGRLIGRKESPGTPGATIR